jgi:hypothetical protein
VGQRGAVIEGDITSLYVKGKDSHQLRTGFVVHDRIISAVMIVVLVSDIMSYIVLRGRWCNIIVLNMHVPGEEKSDYLTL